jgi:Zn-dependent protease
VLTWVVAVAGAALLIASLTAHELGHSLMARRRGVAADDITLWVFGGVSHIRGDWQNARTELAVAAVGPAVTLVIAVLCLGVSWLLEAAPAPALLVLLAQWLSAVNAMLLVFNLIPAFPLDGGRILRSILWTVRHDRARATLSAARVGRVFAYLLIALGFVEVILTGDFGGLWLVIIGWFLESAARGEQRGEAVRQSLQGVRVAEVMSVSPATVPSWITVELFARQAAARPHFTAFPTNSVNGTVDGLVTVNRLRRVPPPQRPSHRISEFMIPIDEVPSTRPDELITDLLSRVNPRSEGHALVFDAGRLVGVVSPSDIGRRLRFGSPQPPPVSVPAPGLPPAA